MWRVEFTKMGKTFNDYPETDDIKEEYQKDEGETVLNLGIYSTGSHLDGLIKVLSEKEERINFIKFNPTRDDLKDQAAKMAEEYASDFYSQWTTFRNPGSGPVPDNSHCISVCYQKLKGSYYCNAHNGMNHNRYCRNQGGEELFFSTFAFKDVIINQGLIYDHDIYKNQWESSSFSYTSVKSLFTDDLVRRNINIVRHDEDFYIESTSRDEDDVDELGILRMTGKIGLRVKIKKPSCGELGDEQILEKLKNTGQEIIDPEEFKNQLYVPGGTNNMGDYIFGYPDLEDNAKLCFTNIPWSLKPKAGQRKKKGKNKIGQENKFEGPVQINFKEGKQSSSVRVYNSGKIVAVNLPVSWNWLTDTLTEVMNQGNVLNIDKWSNLLRVIRGYDNNIYNVEENSNFYIIDKLTHVTGVHGEIYYGGSHSVLNLENAQNTIENLDLGDIVLKSSVILNFSRLIVKLEKDFFKITIQLYTKNYSEKTDDKAIAQIDIALTKEGYQGNDPKANLNPDAGIISEIAEEIKGRIFNNLSLTELKPLAKEEITDKMRQDFSVDGRIPQKKNTGHPMYPCRTAKERPVPYNFTGECRTNPWIHMNYAGVKSEVDNRYYPCCGKDIPKNINKNRVALREGFPNSDQQRRLYDLPEPGEIDWHSGVFSKPIIAGESVKIDYEGEIKEALITEVNKKKVKVLVDESQIEIDRSSIIPQNRTFPGLNAISEEKLRSSVQGFCKNNSEKCEDITFSEECEDIFLKLGIARQNLLPLSANGFESFTKVAYLSAAIPRGAKDMYILLKSDGIFKVDGCDLEKIDDSCGIEPEILLHVFEDDDKFYPIDLLYWDQEIKQPYIKFIGQQLDPECRFAGLNYVWEQCFQDKMEWPWKFLAEPINPQDNLLVYL